MRVQKEIHADGQLLVGSGSMAGTPIPAPLVTCSRRLTPMGMRSVSEAWMLPLAMTPPSSPKGGPGAAAKRPEPAKKPAPAAAQLLTN